MTNNSHNYENDQDKQVEMLKVGRELLKELNEIRSLPDYIAGEDDHDFYLTLSGYRLECLKKAEIYFSKQKQNQESPPISSPSPSSEINDRLSKIEKKISDDGLIQISIKDAINDYLQYYIKQREENKKEIIPPKTKDDKLRTFKALHIILSLNGYKYLKELDQNIVEGIIVESFKRIPQRLNTIYKYPSETNNAYILEKHFEEILEVGITEKRKSKTNDTLNREFTSTKMFLKWAEERKFVVSGLGGFLPTMSDDKDSAIATIPFPESDLRLMFNSKHYIQGKLKTSAKFWLPLLGLYTGCRGNELAFLFKEDIRKHPDNNIYYIYIRRNKELEKRTKSPSSVRSIPIHPQLTKLDFLKFVQSVPDGSRLFPELKEGKKNKGDYYQKYGNYFNKHEIEKKNGEPIINRDGSIRMARGFMTQCGVEKFINTDEISQKKTFHSFRHFMTNWLDKHTEQRTKNFVIGHKQDSGSPDTYLHPDADDLKKAQSVLKKLKFPTIDFSKIRKRKWK